MDVKVEARDRNVASNSAQRDSPPTRIPPGRFAFIAAESEVFTLKCELVIKGETA